MPRYDYQCEVGHVTEVLKGIHENPPEWCMHDLKPNDQWHGQVCGAPLRRVWNGSPSIQLKGEGWGGKTTR